jgi:acyl carrier protein
VLVLRDASVLVEGLKMVECYEKLGDASLVYCQMPLSVNFLRPVATSAHRGGTIEVYTQFALTAKIVSAHESLSTSIMLENKFYRLETTRSLIISQIELVAKEHEQTLAPRMDDLPLLDSGLDSLAFAVIVARLEDQLGADPFSADEVEFPVTVGDFIAAYENLVTDRR